MEFLSMFNPVSLIETLTNGITNATSFNNGDGSIVNTMTINAM